MAGGTVIYTKESMMTKYEEAKQLAQQLAIKTGVAQTPDDLIIRDLNPVDLGAEDLVFAQTLNTAGAYNQTYNTRIIDDKVVVIFGVLVPPTTVSTMMKFEDQSKTKNIIDVEKARFTEDNLILFDDLIAYGKNATIKIENYVPEGATVPTTDHIIVLGVVAENASASEISPSQTL